MVGWGDLLIEQEKITETKIEETYEELTSVVPGPAQEYSVQYTQTRDCAILYKLVEELYQMEEEYHNDRGYLTYRKNQRTDLEHGLFACQKNSPSRNLFKQKFYEVVEKRKKEGYGLLSIDAEGEGTLMDDEHFILSVWLGKREGERNYELSIGTKEIKVNLKDIVEDLEGELVLNGEKIQ